ncbi:hypothetical protein TIFTF001_035851 [Ficus carica]|uniref:NB-ARC domain-containing protein n=1 Tax=Ficus carica TaxID=3494 RepID=A0AA88E5Q3_FICCA|nr:hypothetical protein TIFTF001_035851 [Ficus carica]
MVRKTGSARNHDVQDLSNMRSDELNRYLKEIFLVKENLFVFYDVWQEVGHALPDNEASSRLIITTRSDTVATFFETTSLTHVHRHCPPELEQLSQEIIRMCQGLAVAIVAVAGLLSMKEKTVRVAKLLDNFHVELTSNPHLSCVSKILALSFHDLPCYLKEKFCQLHGLMHEITRQKADELSFCRIINESNSSFTGKNTKVKRLPKSVGMLRNLQTLDLRHTLLVELPVEIKMLWNLRHLLANGYDSNISMNLTQGVRIKEGIGYLESLLILMTVEASLTGVDLKIELEKLRGLRKLGITRLTAEVVSAHCPSNEKMYRLECLSLHATTSHEMLNLQTISSPPSHLQRLALRGLLQTFPNWISSLQNLSLLCLSLSSLSDDPDMQRLEVEHIGEGALPVLEELMIGPSLLLNEVPSGIQHQRSLNVLAFYDMPDEIVLNMQRDGGSDYVKIEHVPSVLFCDDEADSASSSTSNVPWNDMLACDRMSFSSDWFSIFSDDIED